jgi:hypothetical protein
MFGVVLTRHVFGNVQEFSGNKLKTFFFEPRDNAAYQVPLDGVRLNDYQSALCHPKLCPISNSRFEIGNL